jgi:hypothetical protein
MKITFVYQQHKIIPFLQLHMKRVAAVAKTIADNETLPVDNEDIARAMLLHDMGNILKFKFDRFSKELEPEGKTYWERVQQEYKGKYGEDEHLATLSIAQELHMSDRVRELIGSVGFIQSKRNSERDDMSIKICCYSDQRVTPFGVTTLEERIAEARKRYLGNPKYDFDRDAPFLFTIEDQIFSKNKLKPGDITEESIEPLLHSDYFDSLEF